MGRSREWDRRVQNVLPSGALKRGENEINQRAVLQNRGKAVPALVGAIVGGGGVS